MMDLILFQTLWKINKWIKASWEWNILTKTTCMYLFKLRGYSSMSEIINIEISSSKGIQKLTSIDLVNCSEEPIEMRFEGIDAISILVETFNNYSNFEITVSQYNWVKANYKCFIITISVILSVYFLVILWRIKYCILVNWNDAEASKENQNVKK